MIRGAVPPPQQGQTGTEETEEDPSLRPTGGPAPQRAPETRRLVPEGDPQGPGQAIQGVLEALHEQPTDHSRVLPPERIMSPQTAYLMVNMLRDVCIYGTAAEAAQLKRKDIRGKRPAPRTIVPMPGSWA